ncbi:sensor histidine kinase [Spirosoma sp. BT702]|uniref:Sensor histidine kinase n=1 Tax=Spirosoma profusum TaxID=2771354 RepID=A0A926XTF4_9BACT|nr:histidine kinase [Spirosoma profusum]MBD2699968.1 sensor histidine kinase [Spirosoma profusum]
MKHRTRTLLYISGLVLYLALNIVRVRESPKPYWGFAFLFATHQWLTIYLTHVAVLNPLFARKKYGWAVLGLLGCVAFFILFRYFVDEVLVFALVGVRNYFPDTPFSFFAKDNLYYAVPAVLIGLIFKIVEDWFVHQQERVALTTERNTAELAFLKSQVNPHFLFNTLNNIYALAYAKSDAAPGAILKLSELMRYMLYEGNDQSTEANGPLRVPLSKEVRYLENFVELEKLRVANAQVHFSVEGNTDLFRIEPLLLVSFVENAFKHGDLTDPNNPLVLDLSVRNGTLRFDTLNKKTRRQTDAIGGIGLTNVRRRLALLYPNRHRLQISDENESYACSLELNL